MVPAMRLSRGISILAPHSAVQPCQRIHNYYFDDAMTAGKLESCAGQIQAEDRSDPAGLAANASTRRQSCARPSTIWPRVCA